MKKHRILGTIWVIFALYDLFFGVHFLYQYSAPATFWLYMMPNWITFGKIFLGIAGLIIGIAIFRRGDHRFVMPFATLLLSYITIDFIKLGDGLINNTGSNILFLLLALLTIMLNRGFNSTQLRIIKETRTLIFLTVGLMPYILHRWLDYDWFNFLH
ncbi:hypothetical protein SAMN04489723_10415 [Algoriphagus aquimarinus]|uniref:Uncharacterized protein n=1 Tax=Algoriphagus aquimarinus TaxID=237018 RepID=A0A1I0XY93_9BACT|nr:hypothetical protein SAMN04489723_10415 [Algoriphagus aquimarinus]